MAVELVTHYWMVASKRIVDRHVLEEPLYMLVKESLNFCIVEFRINKHGADVRLYDVRQALHQALAEASTQPTILTLGASLIVVQ